MVIKLEHTRLVIAKSSWAIPEVCQWPVASGAVQTLKSKDWTTETGLVSLVQKKSIYDQM